MGRSFEGTVVSNESGLYLVNAGGQMLSCKPRGRFRHEKIRLLSGDRVTVLEDEKGNLIIDEIAPRKNALLRPPAANLDLLFIVIACARPDPITVNVDKLVTVAVENGITPVVIVTKCDLKGNATELKDTYEKAGMKVFCTSCKTLEGVGELRAYLKDECADLISAFAGASGAGKSTLLNALFPGLLQSTGELSKIGRGRHTTRRVDLFSLASLFGEDHGGYVADTPGFSLLDFESYDFCSLEDLPFNFPEFAPYLGTCRYSKCTHRKEEGCSIIAAVKEGKIAPSRHESYKLLYDQLKDKRPWDK